jgi:hypothetical protein
MSEYIKNVLNKTEMTISHKPRGVVLYIISPYCLFRLLGLTPGTPTSAMIIFSTGNVQICINVEHTRKMSRQRGKDQVCYLEPVRLQEKRAYKVRASLKTPIFGSAQ